MDKTTNRAPTTAGDQKASAGRDGEVVTEHEHRPPCSAGMLFLRASGACPEQRIVVGHRRRVSGSPLRVKSPRPAGCRSTPADTVPRACRAQGRALGSDLLLAWENIALDRVTTFPRPAGFKSHDFST